MDNIINRIHHMDCLEGMKLIPDKSIDMILCDLPYGTTQNKWDSVIPVETLWKEYKRLIKDNGAIILTAVKPFSSLLISGNPKMYRYDIIWRKNKSTGFLNAKKMPLRSHEEILVFYKKLPSYNPQKTIGHRPVNSFTKNTSDGTNYGQTTIGISGGGQTDRYPTSVWDISVINNDDPEKTHPTQKPVELFSKLIKTYTAEDDVVLDNCMGSGTTAVAALETNRKFIGFEIEKEYVDLANERLNRLATTV
ncbi:DNA-methyltransferase [Shouchella hunanensis]|uniref:Methyltransferase n=1 Tax=Shouchella hunanensis TaxID=766894 RepID=A0ABY7W4U9_9BACI|nr:site-specific DNA-methyltransferase [Shouchella hunanensis]WDF02920.1 site-specific DNA-methyltransferase [Shouchella hunanensis]